MPAAGDSDEPARRTRNTSNGRPGTRVAPTRRKVPGGPRAGPAQPNLMTDRSGTAAPEQGGPAGCGTAEGAVTVRVMSGDDRDRPKVGAALTHGRPGRFTPPPFPTVFFQSFYGFLQSFYGFFGGGLRGSFPAAGAAPATLRAVEPANAGRADGTRRSDGERSTPGPAAGGTGRRDSPFPLSVPTFRSHFPFPLSVGPPSPHSSPPPA